MPAAVPRVAYACGICAATFYRRAKEAERNGPPKYCSMKCRGLSMRRREEVVCSECGDSYWGQLNGCGLLEKTMGGFRAVESLVVR